MVPPSATSSSIRPTSIGWRIPAIYARARCWWCRSSIDGDCRTTLFVGQRRAAVLPGHAGGIELDQPQIDKHADAVEQVFAQCGLGQQLRPLQLGPQRLIEDE